MDDAPMNQVLEATGFADTGPAEPAAAVRRGAPLPWRNYVRCAFLSAIIVTVGVLAYRPSTLRLSILMSMVSPSRGDSLAWKPEVETDVRPIVVKRAPSPAEWRLTAAHTPGWRASRPGAHDEEHWQGGEFATAPWKRTSYNPWMWYNDHPRGIATKPDATHMPNQKPESAFRTKDSDSWAGSAPAQPTTAATPTPTQTSAPTQTQTVATEPAGDTAAPRESRVPSLAPIAPPRTEPTAAPATATATPSIPSIPSIAPLPPAGREETPTLATTAADAPTSLQLPALPGGDTLFGSAAAPAQTTPPDIPATTTPIAAPIATPAVTAAAEPPTQQPAAQTPASLRPPTPETTAPTASPAPTAVAPLPTTTARQEQPIQVVTMPTEVNPVRPLQPAQPTQTQSAAAATTDLMNEAVRIAESSAGVLAPRTRPTASPAAPAATPSGPVDWKNREITTAIAGAYLTIYPKLKFIGLCVPGQGYIRKYNQVAVPMDVTQPKLHAADGHTPYGKYYIARHERGADGARLLISWPSSDDAKRSGAGPEMLAEIERAWRSQNLPPQSSTAGGGVALTGDRGTVEATMGGFALEQPHMEEIFTALPDGAWVFIQK